jgi:hypothetical protein
LAVDYCETSPGVSWSAFRPPEVVLNNADVPEN